MALHCSRRQDYSSIAGQNRPLLAHGALGPAMLFAGGSRAHCRMSQHSALVAYSVVGLCSAGEGAGKGPDGG
jgi:hypothetical protein